MGMFEVTDWLEQIPAMALNYGYDKDMMGFLKTYGQSTISLTMEIRKDPKGAQWLLQRAVMNAAKNGRFDLDIKIIDEDGDLVASVCQVNKLIPLRRAAL
jgi:acyl-CoA thioesterase